MGAACVLGFGEDAQMASPFPHAKPQGPVPRFSTFCPLEVERGRQL